MQYNLSPLIKQLVLVSVFAVAIYSSSKGEDYSRFINPGLWSRGTSKN